MNQADMLKLKRWNSPTVYNGWEAIARRDRLDGVFNREECRDFMPWAGPMVGRAVTVAITVTDPGSPARLPRAWDDWYAHLASIPGPKIVVMEDRSVPAGQGSFWGEVSANTHRSLGCVGTITDGAVRDIDEMANAGFTAIARRLCVGHLYAWPVEWNVPVRVFGQVVEPGILVHADRHGFVGVPAEDEEGLLEAVRAMDEAECESVIPAGRFAWGRDFPSLLAERGAAALRYRELASRVARRSGEW